MTRYRQMRRHARQARRAGLQPMLFINPNDPLPELVIIVISRWLWRHRSAFAPLGIALAAFIIAATFHPHHARYWIPVTALTTAAVLVLALPPTVLRQRSGILTGAWDKLGIPRTIERAYLTAVAAVTGGWLAAAIAAGPAVKPLRLTAFAATVILSIPWWFHRRRRAKVRVEKAIASWPDIADAVGLPGSRIVSAVVDAWGWTAHVMLRKGTTTAHAIARIPEIESGLGLRPGSVRILPDQKRADQLTMRIIENDPHAEPIPWPGQWITSITKPMDIGLSEDGRPVRVLLLRRNVLIGGIMGAGKSGILNLIIANLAGCRDVVIWGIDLKGGMELQPWARCFERLAVNPEQAVQLFKDAVTRLNERAARKTAEGKRVWEPMPSDPALVIIVDEWAELPVEAREYADSIARRGRAVAENIVAATQRPTQEAMGKGTAIRSQMDIRICLRVREPRDTDLILGQGMVNSGWHAYKLTQPGEFLISSPDHVLPERNRAYLLTDARRDYHATQCTPARQQPGASSQPDISRTTPEQPQVAEHDSANTGTPPRPETALWDALVDAGPEGIAVSELEIASGMARRWVYYRLQEHARAARAIQVRRGYWRAARQGDDTPPAPPGSDGL